MFVKYPVEMVDEDYICIGYTQKTHGLKGEIKASVEERYWEDFIKSQRVFLDIKTTKVPYFLAEVRGENALIVRFEDVKSKTEAEGLQSRKIFLRRKDLIPDHLREMEVLEEDAPYAHLPGWVIVDQTLGEVGVIKEIINMPRQELAVVGYQQRDVLIPLHPNLWVAEDADTKTLHMQLPDGLLDL